MLFSNEMFEEKAKNLWESLRILSFEQQPKAIQKILLQIVKRLEFIIITKKGDLN